MERGSLTENNGTITNVQLLRVMEKFNFFQNFKNSLMGGHDEKLKKFSQIEKIIIDLYELDNSKKKIFFEKNFQNRDSKCHFLTNFEQK